MESSYTEPILRSIRNRVTYTNYQNQLNRYNYTKVDFNSRIESIKKFIQKGGNGEETQFNHERLVQERYLNYQIDDCYSYPNKIIDPYRTVIIEELLRVFTNWEYELEKMGQDYYLAIWLYEPRLPISEIVCAIGEEQIQYYRNEIFDKSERIDDLAIHAKNTNFFNGLDWLQKIDYDTLQQWEIDTPKSSYEYELEYKKDQLRFENFVKNATKVEADKKRGEKYRTYYKDVGSIWVGERKNRR